MKEALIDTDIISLFLKGHHKVSESIQEYLLHFPTLNICILTYYEILSGLKHRDAHRKLHSFLELCESATIYKLTKASASHSAQIYADLRSRGQIIDDVDILIAGICLDNNLRLVTNNWKHFSRIKDLEVENWSL